MRISKSLKLAMNILLHSKLRSWLTIIGIVIGIAAVVSIVSISQGAQKQLEASLGDFGADVLIITPGYSQAKASRGGFRKFGEEESSTNNIKNLTDRDILVLKTINNADLVMGVVSGNGDLSYSGKSASLSIQGVNIDVWKDLTSEELDSGRFLTKGDSYSVVLGGNIVDSIFEEGIPLNSKVTIEGKSFKIVGISEEGSTIYMPINIARDILEDVGKEEFNSISVKMENADLSYETVELIEKKLMLSRGILNEDDRDFTVYNLATIQEVIQEAMGFMALFLGAIAAISLLVGAIGIANTMFTSVLEKTKEIGIMKAIGARNKDILLIFLLNSGMIGLVGGIGGVILGALGSGFISALATGGGASKMFGSTLIIPELLIGALAFSMLLGMIAGAIPAYRASRLNPVDALRYE